MNTSANTPNTMSRGIKLGLIISALAAFAYLGLALVFIKADLYRRPLLSSVLVPSMFAAAMTSILALAAAAFEYIRLHRGLSFVLKRVLDAPITRACWLFFAVFSGVHLIWTIEYQAHASPPPASFWLFGALVGVPIAFALSHIALRFLEGSADSSQRLAPSNDGDERIGAGGMDALLFGMHNEPTKSPVRIRPGALRQKSVAGKDLLILRELSNETKSRLSRETKSLLRRGILNLLIGVTMTIASTGLLIYVLVFALNRAGGALDAESWYAFITRIGLGVTMQIVSFFFLGLYRSSLNEVKYYQNELTNIEAIWASIVAACVVGDKPSLSLGLSRLAGMERNFLLKKGESTIQIEQGKLESGEGVRLMNLLRLVRGA